MERSRGATAGAVDGNPFQTKNGKSDVLHSTGRSCLCEVTFELTDILHFSDRIPPHKIFGCFPNLTLHHTVNKQPSQHTEAASNADIQTETQPTGGK